MPASALFVGVPPRDQLVDPATVPFYRGMFEHYAMARVPTAGADRGSLLQLARHAGELGGWAGEPAVDYYVVSEQLIRDEERLDLLRLPKAFRCLENLERSRRQRYELGDRRVLQAEKDRLAAAAEAAIDGDPVILQAIDFRDAVAATDEMHAKLERQCEFVLLVSAKLVIEIAMRRGKSPEQAGAIVNALYPAPGGAVPTHSPFELRHYGYDCRAYLTELIGMLDRALRSASAEQGSELWVWFRTRHCWFANAIHRRTPDQVAGVVSQYTDPTRTWSYACAKITKYLTSFCDFFWGHVGPLLERSGGAGYRDELRRAAEQQAGEVELAEG
ncbi:hypothetical protein DFJ74DRAFT_689729 [Hyaloraphidium curvatum]|nr:hypothetical protein DFJ74DRAFT_689729 [Hyaloraphidium curvatum]